MEIETGKLLGYTWTIEQSSLPIKYNITYFVESESGWEHNGRLNLPMEESIEWIKEQINHTYSDLLTLDINPYKQIVDKDRIGTLLTHLNNSMRNPKIRDDPDKHEFICDELFHLVQRLRDEL